MEALRQQTNSNKQSEDPQKALSELIDLASQIAKINHYTGRIKPDVMT